MRLPKEEYNKAKNCLKRYSYNCVNILSIPNDLIGIGGMKLDGMPHAQGRNQRYCRKYSNKT